MLPYLFNALLLLVIYRYQRREKSRVKHLILWNDEKYHRRCQNLELVKAAIAAIERDKEKLPSLDSEVLGLARRHLEEAEFEDEEMYPSDELVGRELYCAGRLIELALRHHREYLEKVLPAGSSLFK